MDKLFILRELAKTGHVTEKGDGAIITCPFHDQHNPIGTLHVSLGLKATAGIWNCWSCTASGSWNVLAIKLGLRTVGGEQDLEQTYFVKNEKVPLFTDIEEEDLILKALPVGFKWKTYSKDFLERFNAKLLWQEKIREYFLYFPITSLGDYQGYIRVKIYNETEGLKYWFSFKTKLPYPIDYLMDQDTRTIVLVEGISDAFRLLRYNIPSMALLGVRLTDNIKDSIEAIGIENIVLCLDGDEPGRQAAFRMAGEIDKLGLNVRVIIPPDELDPDTMPKSYIRVIKYLLNKF